MRIITIGEILWDLFPEEERLGGATFNFSAHAAKLGNQVVFVSAVAGDERGRGAVQRVRQAGVDLSFLQKTDEAPTGTVTVTIDEADAPSYVIHRPAAYDYVRLGPDQIARLLTPRPDWIYYGTLHQIVPEIESLTKRIIDAAPGVKRFYDVNLRRDSYTKDLLKRLISRASLIKINESEAWELGEIYAIDALTLESLSRSLIEAGGVEGICITRGARGCALLLGGEWIEIPGVKIEVTDAVGAGDAFSAALLHGLGQGWPPRKAGDFANRVGALVASRSGAIPRWSEKEAWAL